MLLYEKLGECKLFFFLYRIISSFVPWHTSQDSPYSFYEPKKYSFFFYSFYHIFTTAWKMLTVGRIIFCPETMVRREYFLVESNQRDKKFLYNIHEKIDSSLRLFLKSLHFYYNIFLEKIQWLDIYQERF